MRQTQSRRSQRWGAVGADLACVHGRRGQSASQCFLQQGQERKVTEGFIGRSNSTAATAVAVAVSRKGRKAEVYKCIAANGADRHPCEGSASSE